MNDYGSFPREELIKKIQNLEENTIRHQENVFSDPGFKQIQQKAEFYSDLFQKSPDGMIIENKENKIIAINKIALGIINKKEEDILGSSLLDFFSIENQENFTHIRESFFQSGQSAVFTVKKNIQCSENYIFEMICNAYESEFGQRGNVITIIRNITLMHKKNTIARLKEKAISASANGIIITDKASVIIWANKAICDTTGYEINELIGNKPNIFKSGVHGNDFYRDLLGTIHSGKVWQGVITNIKKDKSYYHENMTITPITDMNGEISNFIAVKEDITQRKIFEDDLKKSDNLFKTRIQNLQGYIYDIVYKDGEVLTVYHSPQCKQITGYASDEYSKNPNLWYDMIYEEDKEMVSEFIKNHKENKGRTSQIDHRIIAKDGQIRWLSNTVTTIMKSDNTIMREVGFVNDITDRKIAELELENYRDNLEQMVEIRTHELENANRQKTIFLSHISHELRTPLNSILVLSHNMHNKSDDKISAKYKKYLGIIERNGKSLLKMINEILDLTSIEIGKMQIQKSFFNIVELVEATVAQLNPLASQKGLKIHLGSQMTPVNVTTDIDRLGQVLVNIISNAIKYTDEGGIYINCGYNDEYAFINIKDTGHGVDKSEIKNLFTEFYRSPVFKHKVEGTGLGLPIARKIIELMDGKIEVESEIGNGSCFSVFIPLNGG